MGFLGGDDNDSQDQANQLMQQQLQQNAQELEYKRQSLTNQRMAIIKSQGAQSFTPDPIVGVSEPSNPIPGGNNIIGRALQGMGSQGNNPNSVGGLIEKMKGQ